MNLVKHSKTPQNGSLMNWIFDDFFTRDAFNSSLAPKGWSSSFPNTNILENEKDFVLELAVPGYEKKEFNLDLEDNALKISAHRETESEDKTYKMKEFSVSKFERTFKLSNNIDTENIKAEYANGILSITLPKIAKKRKAIDIKVK